MRPVQFPTMDLDTLTDSEVTTDGTVSITGGSSDEENVRFALIVSVFSRLVGTI